MSENVTIKLTVIAFGKGVFYFKKPAPKLPSYLTWHEGVMLEIVKKRHWLIVDHVVLNLDGSVHVVVNFEMPGTGWGAMTESAWWENRGWKPCKQND